MTDLKLIPARDLGLADDKPTHTTQECATTAGRSPETCGVCADLDELPAREAYYIIDSDAEHLRRENEILRKGLSVSREMEHAALKRVEALEAENEALRSDASALAKRAAILEADE